MRRVVQLLVLCALPVVAGTSLEGQYPPPNPDRDKCFSDCGYFEQTCFAFGGEPGGSCGFNHETNECINTKTCTFYYYD
jgi:hypothetical protein